MCLLQTGVGACRARSQPMPSLSQASQSPNRTSVRDPFLTTRPQLFLTATLPDRTLFVGAVTSETGFNGQPAAGILGLAFSSISVTRSPTFVESVVASKALTSNLFAFYLTRQQASGSLLSIGATNPAHYSGQITYTPVISQTYVCTSLLFVTYFC